MAKKIIFERNTFLNQNDKKAIANSLKMLALKDKEKRVITHGKTYLYVSKTMFGNRFKVKKSVSGGKNYTYSSYFAYK